MLIASLLARLAPYRAMFIAAALGVALLAAAAGGAIVNGWRLDGAHQRALATKQGEYDALASTVREQNRAVDALAAAKVAADERRQLAEKLAAGAIARAGARGAAAASSKATDCDGVMREAWEGWK
jgi:hypothetical protein